MAIVVGIVGDTVLCFGLFFTCDFIAFRVEICIGTWKIRAGVSRVWIKIAGVVL